MNYFHQGKGKKVLFIPGWGRSIADFEAIAKKEVLDSLVIDLPGFGKSAEQAQLLNPTDYANYLHQFLVELNFTPDIIVGHSFGAKIAGLLQQQFINSRLILLAPAVITYRPLKIKIKIAWYKIRKHFPGKRSAGSADYRAASAHMKQVLNNHLSQPLNLDKLRKVTIIAAGEDSAVPMKVIRKIKRKIPDCRLIVIPGDHLAPLTYHYLLIKEIRRA